MRNLKLKSEAKWYVATTVTLLLWLVLNTLTATRSPTVWNDEVVAADPAVNYLSGHGFTSTAWHIQRENELFAGNAPLYTLSLIPWLKLFGINPTAVRTLNLVFVLFSLAAFLVTLRRSGVRSSGMVSFIATIIFIGGFAVSFSYRAGRYDPIGMALFSMLCAATTIRGSRLRWTILALCAAPIPSAGLQLLPLLAISSISYLLVFGWNRIIDVAAAALGAITGLLSWFAYMWVNGVFEAFVATVTSISNAFETMGHRFQEILWGLRSDISSLWLMFMLLSIAAIFWNDRPLRRIVISGLGASLAIISGVALAGKFPVYYGWMAYLPLLLSVSLTVDRLNERGVRQAQIFAVCCLLAAAPLPYRFVTIAVEWNERDYSYIERLVSSNISASDTVLLSAQAYYPTKLAARRIFLVSYDHLSKSEAADISALVVTRSDIETAKAMVDDEWEQVAAYRSTSSALRFGNTSPYDLVVFRRAKKSHKL